MREAEAEGEELEEVLITPEPLADDEAGAGP
jgi:hypothetical protein